LPTPSPDSPPPVDAFSVGTRFGPNGRFELVKLIGVGGVGRVFHAWDHRLGRNVAAKFMVDRAGACAEQALFEGRAAARLAHENVVHVYDVGEHADSSYLLMEYVDGRGLDDVIGGKPLSFRRTLRIATQIARALEHAHGAGVLHLDLKPSNVLISRSGQAKVIDFGVAGFLAARGAQGAAFEDDPSLVGTPGYMAPEQWMMSGVDERTDIWAFAVSMFEMLTGRLPWAPNTTSPLTRWVPHQSIDSFGWGRTALGRLIADGLAPEIAIRPRSAAELLKALSRAKSESATAVRSAP
jgi:serine/threonine-protein kinase